MSKVTMYSTRWCPYCRLAEQLLRSKGVTELDMIDVEQLPGGRETMIARTGRRTVPQVFVGATHVGGYDDLSALDRRGQLEPLLAQ
ncbi:MAG TPA: glutaredoxin 3 [Rhodocyclaceae bacterium]|nr:glutaredoxin 3 [Rhodocyclaceae bacterium]